MIKLNKKAGLDNWAETWTIVALVLGLILSLAIQNIWLNYLVIFVAGIIGGRLVHQYKQSNRFIFYLIIIGFILGYMLGSYYAPRKIVMLIFVATSAISYHIHKKGYFD